MKVTLMPVVGLLTAGVLAAGLACSDRDGGPGMDTPATTGAATQTSPGTATAEPTTTSTGTAAANAQGDDLSVAEVVELAEPSVVRIESGGGVGSGFIVDEDGYIVTNNHVVQGATGQDQGTVQVTLSDGEELVGQVVGTDPRADLALVKIEGGPYETLEMANLDDVRIGEDVVAIGYALDLQRGEGPSYSVTRGIVSQKNRAINEASILGAIQTDAAINHGNSGGPLLNLQGQVVGVNTSLVPDGSGGTALGIGLAVGSDTVKAVYEELREQGAVTRGLLGIRSFESLRPAKARELGVPEELGGVYLESSDNIPAIDPSGPGALGGLEPADVIVEINGEQIENENDLAIAMIHSEPGATVDVEVYRAGERITLQVTLGDASAQ